MKFLEIVSMVLFLLYAFVEIVGITLAGTSAIWEDRRQVWEVIVGIVSGFLFAYFVLMPLFYYLPKAAGLVFKGILRPAGILKLLRVPAIVLGSIFLITTGYFKNGFVKSCVKVVAGLHISITQPFTYYAAIIIIAIFSLQFFSEEGRLYEDDKFWGKMEPYRK